MVEKNSPDANVKTDQVLADRVLSDAIGQSLDKSLDQIDELDLQRLKHARKKALAGSPVVNRQWIGLSVAASIAVLLLVPVVINQQTESHAIAPELEVVSQEMPVSTEEMDDIDMLMALEDSDA